MENKNVLVIGLGISGVSIIQALNKMKADISIYDSKSEDELKDILEKIDNVNYKSYLGRDNIDFNSVDLVIKSPGVPPKIDVLKRAKELGIEIITDIEFAYRVSDCENFIGVTGTNGKTTTTTLVGELLNNGGYETYITGNIGVGILDYALEAKKDDALLIECSSFQLNDIVKFKPKVSLIINLSPDHLDWHGSYEEYIRAKENIFINQDENDYTVLNYDDKYLKNIADKVNSNIVWFSNKEELEEGIYLKDNYVVSRKNGIIEEIINIKDIPLLGKHNLENVMGCVGIGLSMGIDTDVIKNTIMNFKAVEHRLEYVDTLDGITFYNDSKGTNVEASIKAIEAMEKPIILIAGGYDKGSEYEDFIKSFEGRVKQVVLLGQTKDKIKDTCDKLGFGNYHMVEDMSEAVKKAFDLAEEGDTVLLSPACASWGMYPSYEVRGRHFKELVTSLKEE